MDICHLVHRLQNLGGQLMHGKGIFCLEGLWDDSLRDKSSVLPLLQMLQTVEKIEYIHRNCATVPEFEFYIKKWVKKRYSDFQILYLSFHGEREKILLNGKDKYPINALANYLGGKCKNKVIILGSCSVLDTDKRHLKKFLRETKAAAICGYKNDVDWIKSSAFEMLLLSALQENAFDGRGIGSIEKKLKELSNPFKEIDFRFVSNCPNA
jgi:hypothetical protein